jgi:hypothetical protein
MHVVNVFFLPFLVYLQSPNPPTAIYKCPKYKKYLKPKTIKTNLAPYPTNPPVLPIPALQCTTIGGPLGCPAHVSPNATTIAFCFLLTRSKNSSIALADLGTP